MATGAPPAPSTAAASSIAAAPTSPVAAPAPETTAPTSASQFRDGTYLGWGTSRHGDIQAEVVVDGGRITVARVAQCLTRYSCDWIEPIPVDCPRLAALRAELLALPEVARCVDDARPYRPFFPPGAPDRD